MHDFRKFATKHQKISSTYFDDYFNKIQKQNNTLHIIDDSVEGMIVDVYSKLLDNRIIFLSTEMDSEICNVIKAQLLYLENIDPNKDIKIYIDSPGGSVS